MMRTTITKWAPHVEIFMETKTSEKLLRPVPYMSKNMLPDEIHEKRTRQVKSVT